MPPMNEPHISSVLRLTELFVRRFTNRAPRGLGYVTHEVRRPGETLSLAEVPEGQFTVNISALKQASAI